MHSPRNFRVEAVCWSWRPAYHTEEAGGTISHWERGLGIHSQEMSPSVILTPSYSESGKEETQSVPRS